MSRDRNEDPKSMSLSDWLNSRGTRTGTYTFNDITYTDMNEVDWRIANNDWRSPTPGPDDISHGL